MSAAGAAVGRGQAGSHGMGLGEMMTRMACPTNRREASAGIKVA